jgi:hypothetical protein
VISVKNQIMNCSQHHILNSKMFFNIVARDLPSGKRILMINMRAQHITFHKAIKTVKILKNFYCNVSSLT